MAWKIDELKAEIEKQKKWLKDHGSTLEAYVERYGDPDLDYCYGGGGTAIWRADRNALIKLEAALELREADAAAPVDERFDTQLSDAFEFRFEFNDIMYGYNVQAFGSIPDGDTGETSIAIYRVKFNTDLDPHAVDAFITEEFPSKHCTHEGDCCGNFYPSRGIVMVPIGSVNWGNELYIRQTWNKNI